MTVSETSLIALIIAALTADDCGPQASGSEFDAEKHRIVGDVPMAVRNLHNVGASLNQEGRAAVEAIADDDEAGFKQARPQLEALSRKLDTISGLRWSLLHDIFPLPEDAKGHVILNDWKVAFLLKSEAEKTHDMLFDLLRGAGAIFVEVARHPVH
jgi:hypothetical protein